MAVRAGAVDERTAVCVNRVSRIRGLMREMLSQSRRGCVIAHRQHENTLVNWSVIIISSNQHKDKS